MVRPVVCVNKVKEVVESLSRCCPVVISCICSQDHKKALHHQYYPVVAADAVDADADVDEDATTTSTASTSSSTHASTR